MASINKKPVDISKLPVELSHADSKMYILVFERVPDAFVPVVAAHASLACYLKFKDAKVGLDLTMDEYIEASFKKVVCRISEAEYTSYVKDLPHSFLMSESNLGYHTCVVCAPRITWPKPFKFFRMWKPNLNPPENDQKKIQVNYK